MVYFAITSPKRISYPKELTDSNAEVVSEMNSIISMYSGGGFMSSDIAQSEAAQRLISSKLLSIGIGEYPFEAMTNCLKNCVFELAEGRDKPLRFHKNGVYHGTVSPHEHFTIEELAINPIEDAACICMDLLRNNFIKLVQIG